MLFGNIEWKKLEVLTSILPMQGVDIITPVGGAFLFLPVTAVQVRPILTTPYNKSRDISKKVG